MTVLGQATATGGQTFAINNNAVALRQVTLTERGFFNEIGLWGFEGSAANSNSIRAAIYSTLGAKLAETRTKPTPLGLGPTPQSTAAVFSDSPILAAGTYLIAVAAGGGTGSVSVNGQTGTSGTPVSANTTSLGGNWPTFPANISGLMDSAAARAWDIRTDYTALASGFVHGKASIGTGGWVSFEGRRKGMPITLTSEQTATTIRAYIRSVGTAANGTRCSIYDRTTGLLLYTSNVLAGFTDTVGQWRDYVFTQTIPAGNYWLTISAEFISGGGNTVEIAYDTIAIGEDATNESWFIPPEQTWPTQTPDLNTQDDSDYTHNQVFSIYMVTTSAGGGTANHLAITSQPGNTVVGQTMANLVVQAATATNEVDTSFVGNVTVSIQTGSGVLLGTLTRTAVAGVATFNDLAINTLNTGLILRATSSGLTLADSTAFNIVAGSGGGGGGRNPVSSLIV